LNNFQASDFPTVFDAEMHDHLEVTFLSYPGPIVLNAAEHPILVDDKLHTFDNAPDTSAWTQSHFSPTPALTRTDYISFRLILRPFRATFCTIHSGLDQSFPHPIQRRFVSLGLTLGVFGRFFLRRLLFCSFFRRHFFFCRRLLLYRFGLFFFGLLFCFLGRWRRNFPPRLFWGRLGSRRRH